MKKLIGLMIDCLAMAIPFSIIKPLLPRRLVFYGHLISDELNPVISSLYRYPARKDITRVVTLMKRCGYRFCSYNDYLRPERHDRRVLMTFDDGLKEIRTSVYPLLKSLDVPFMIFIMSAPFAKQSLPFSTCGTVSSAIFLTRDEVADLKKKGVAVGFHTRGHKKLSAKSGHRSAHEEIEVPAKHKSLLTKPYAFAYPFAAPEPYDEIDALAREKGFDIIFDTKGLRQADGAHIFRVSMDVRPGLPKVNPLIFNLKREVLVALLKGRRYR